jgi:hypothetical protein
MFLGRNGLVALLAVAIWLLCFYGQYRPPALALDAPQKQFSAARAGQVLARLLGPERPHPAGTPENAQIHARLSAELAHLGVKAETLSTMSCYGERRFRAVTCAHVSDIIGDVADGSGPAIVLMAHMDSVAAGPGAADDGSGVATILETIRAWKARGLPTKHPILALFTDGEENAMLGASAFLADPGWRARVGVVINMEARGNQGRSFLFQTSPGDGALVDLYAHAVPHLATSSLYAEIYKILPNDTDLTPFLEAGDTGYNFAFVGDVAQYHTPRDRRENIDPRALQQHGESALGLVTALAATDFTRLKSPDAIYFDVLGFWLPRFPKSWALPLSLLAFAAIAFVGWRTKERARRFRGIWMPPALLLGALAMGFLLHEIAALISGYPDPSFAHPYALRLALAFGVWCVALIASRVAVSAVQAWLWIAGLGIAVAIFVPGFSPYFLFPSLIAALLFLLSAPLGKGAQTFAVALTGLAGAFAWLDLAATGEAIMGLVAHPLFTLSAGMASIALLPMMRGKRATALAGGSLAAALVFAVIAGFLPPFSYAAPERVNLHYVEQGGKSFWLADAAARLPSSLRVAGHFGGATKSLFGRAYRGEGGPAQFAAPGAGVGRDGDRLTVSLKGSAEADGMMLAASAPFTVTAVNGRHFDLPPATRLICDTPDCAEAIFTLEQTHSTRFDVTEMRRGLPPKGNALLEARPPYAVPSGAGDQTLLMRTIAAP